MSYLCDEDDIPRGWSRLEPDERMRSGDMSYRVGSRRYLTIDESDVGKKAETWGHTVVRFRPKAVVDAMQAEAETHERDDSWGWWKSHEVFQEAAKLHNMGMGFEDVMLRLKDVHFMTTLGPMPFEAAVEVCMDTAPGFTRLLDRRTFSVTWDLCVKAAVRATVATMRTDGR
jgi:hypothetical protein